MKRKGWLPVFALGGVIAAWGCGGTPAMADTTGDSFSQPLDERLQPYVVQRGIWGKLRLAGTPATTEYMGPLLDRFQQFYPFVITSLASEGTSTGPVALANGEADLALMARRMRPDEMEEIVAVRGRKPACVRLCMDAMVVVAHHTNPVESLEMRDLQRLFAQPRAASETEPADNWSSRPQRWGEVMRSASSFGRSPVHPYTISAGGTRNAFQRTILGRREFADDKITVLEDWGDLMLAMRGDRFGLTFSSRSQIEAGLRVVAIQVNNRTVRPNDEMCRVVDYPFVRFIYAYFDLPEEEPPDPVVAEFLRYHFSREGQELVQQAGFVPLSAAQGQILIEEMLTARL